MLGDRQSDGTGQLVGVALDERVERLARVELWVKVAGGSIQNGRGLVTTLRGLRWLYIDGTLAFLIDTQAVLLVGDDTVSQADIGLETVGERPVHQAYIMLLEIFAEVSAGHLHEESGIGFREGLEDDGLEPRFVLLLRNVLPD